MSKMSVCSMIMVLLGLLVLPAVAQEPEASGKEGGAKEEPLAVITAASGMPEVRLDFEECEVGKVPERWNVEATSQDGPLATWKIVEDPSAPEGPKVLAVTETNHASNETLNICWTDKFLAQDVQVEVMFKAVGGETAQGGGSIWRFQDKNNYYHCRANPLENNIRVCLVKDGQRSRLASADVELNANTWYELEVTHDGDRIDVQLDEKDVLTVQDNALPEAGNVGVWTKADAITSFDAFQVEFE